MQSTIQPEASPRIAFAERTAALLVLSALLVLANGIGNASPYIYLVCLVLAWPFLLRDQNGRDAMKHPVGIGYLLAFACVAVGFAGSASSMEDVAHLGNFLPLILFFPAFALFNRQANSNGTQVFALFALLGAGVALASAIYDVWWAGLDRAKGFVNLTNPFAMASIMLGFLPLMGLLTGKGPWRLIFLLGPVFGIMAGLLAGTRSAPLIAVVVSTIFAGFLFFRLPKRLRLIWVGAIILVVVSVILALFAFGDNLRALRGLDVIYSFITEGTVPDRSSEVRVQLYVGAINAFLEAPIFGYGWYDHVEAGRQFMAPDVAELVAGWSHYHNDYLNFAALAGIFGLAFYALYLLLPIWGAFRSEHDGQFAARLYGAMTISATYGVHGLFNTAFGAELLFCFAPVATAVLLGYCKDQPTNRLPAR
ncbi:O-antigen ligase family protein [Pelagibacterium sp.]|uniref:O-antigen ligase family protein n=1 Tax=Pelagibacterium sp. TaxID=1967288 RepID=UPI003A95B7E3